MEDFEKPGMFYIGKGVDSTTGKIGNVELYESKNLTTHAVCVGMTGSGKTGLGITLLEEAGLNKIPALIIDPKGDLSNLLLTFPHLSPDEFKPWVNTDEAERKGMSVDEYSEYISRVWKDGLAAWGEDTSRIQKFRNSIDLSIYTPASRAGIPLSILGSFAAPPKEQLLDADGLRDKILSITSSLLGLLGIKADPVKSREHILISTIIQNAWQNGKNLTISSLIQEVQKPAFAKIGAMDVETFYPSKDRVALSISLNNFLASPGFHAWMEGESLDIKKLLGSSHGKPKLSIISIAHLSDPERMFFVTLFLNEVLTWMRGQSGTTSLRALLYMDEIFGFFPPTAMPPSKLPMLTLLKQARAFGLGIMLATQNPVDLDYKGLANCGTWFIGKLQTERDKARVIEGLKIASNGELDPNTLNKMIALTGNRTFIMRSIHEKNPILFQTRWTLSYMRGPLTLTQIAQLMNKSDEATAERSKDAFEESKNSLTNEKPTLPPSIEEFFIDHGNSKKPVHYEPRIMGIAKLHFVDSKKKIDVWEDVSLALPVADNSRFVDWKAGENIIGLKDQMRKEYIPNSTFGELPASLMQEKNYQLFSKDLSISLYQNQIYYVYQCLDPYLTSKHEESEKTFRLRVSEEIQNKKGDLERNIRDKYSVKINALKEKMRRSEEKMTEKKQKKSWQMIETVLSFLSTLIGALFGRKLTKGTITQTGTSLRRATRITRDSQDEVQMEEGLKTYQSQLEDLEFQMNAEITAFQSKGNPDQINIETIMIRPRKSDIFVERIALLWWS